VEVGHGLFFHFFIWCWTRLLLYWSGCHLYSFISCCVSLRVDDIDEVISVILVGKVMLEGVRGTSMETVS